MIATTPGGYSINVDDEHIDRFRVGTMASSAEALYRQGSVAEAADLLRDATELFHGQPLADVDSLVLQRDIVVALQEEYLNLLERRIELDLEAGRHASVVAELRVLVQRHPLRENLWRYLMVALARGGRQAEALAAYADVRARLADDLGLDPGIALRDAHQFVLTGEDHSATGARAVHAAGARIQPTETPEQDHSNHGDGPAAHALGQTWLPSCTLPPPVPNFLGREELAERIADWLNSEPSSYAGPRVAVIHGLVGFGKTALALHIAHNLLPTYPDGQYWLRLDGTAGNPTDPRELLGDLLCATGVTSSALPGSAQARTAVYRGRMHGRKTLLVFDDAGDPSQINALLPGTNNCAALVTSRRAIAGVDGEVEHFRLPPLTHDNGHRLLERMVGAQRTASEPESVREIASHCDGNPLALRIIGSRISKFPERPISSVLDRFRDTLCRLDQLQSDELQVRSGFAVGYAAMPEDMQRVFRRTHLFGGHSFTAWALGVLGETSDADHVVESLVSHGMIEPVGLDEAGIPRYRMHQLLASYAAELAGTTASSDHEGALRLLLDGYLTLCKQADQSIAVLMDDEMMSAPVPFEPVPLDISTEQALTEPSLWLRSERSIICELVAAANRNGWYLHAEALLGTLAPVGAEDGSWDQLAGLYARIRDTADADGDTVTALRAEIASLSLLRCTGDLDGCARGYQACIERLRSVGDSNLLARALTELALCREQQDKPDEALRLAELAQENITTEAHPPLHLIALRTMASTCSATGQYTRALELFDRALTLNEEAGRNPLSQSKNRASLLNFLAYAAQDHGDTFRARDAARQALELLDMIGDKYGIACTLSLLARIELSGQNARAAESFAVRSREEFRELADDRGHARASIVLSRALVSRGAYREVIETLDPLLPTIRSKISSDPVEVIHILETAKTQLT